MDRLVLKIPPEKLFGSTHDSRAVEEFPFSLLQLQIAACWQVLSTGEPHRWCFRHSVVFQEPRKLLRIWWGFIPTSDTDKPFKLLSKFSWSSLSSSFFSRRSPSKSSFISFEISVYWASLIIKWGFFFSRAISTGVASSSSVTALGSALRRKEWNKLEPKLHATHPNWRRIWTTSIFSSFTAYCRRVPHFSNLPCQVSKWRTEAFTW